MHVGHSLRPGGACLLKQARQRFGRRRQHEAAFVRIRRNEEAFLGSYRWNECTSLANVNGVVPGRYTVHTRVTIVGELDQKLFRI